MLDELDRRIVYALDQNSRVSLTDIAKQVRSIPETVRYRIDNLMSRGIITNFFATIDSGRLSFHHAKLLLRLQELGDVHVEEIVSYLKRNQLCLRLSRYDGDYDLGCVLKVSRLDRLDQMLRDLNSRFGQYIA